MCFSLRTRSTCPGGRCLGVSDSGRVQYTVCVCFSPRTGSTRPRGRCLGVSRTARTLCGSTTRLGRKTSTGSTTSKCRPLTTWGQGQTPAWKSSCLPKTVSGSHLHSLLQCSIVCVHSSKPIYDPLPQNQSQVAAVDQS